MRAIVSVSNLCEASKLQINKWRHFRKNVDKEEEIETKNISLWYIYNDHVAGWQEQIEKGKAETIVKRHNIHIFIQKWPQLRLYLNPSTMRVSTERFSYEVQMHLLYVKFKVQMCVEKMIVYFIGE